MTKPDNKNQVGKIATILIPTWLITATFGDELFALIFFRSAESAFGFSIGKPWWWAYQLIVASVFVLVLLVLLWVRSKTPIPAAIADAQISDTDG